MLRVVFSNGSRADIYPPAYATDPQQLFEYGALCGLARVLTDAVVHDDPEAAAGNEQVLRQALQAYTAKWAAGWSGSLG